MKVFAIFNKNLKTVSRNGGYFAVLFICPILLIIVAGFMVNSNSMNNAYVGIVDESSGIDMDFSNYNILKFNNNPECISALTNSKVVTCLYITENGYGYTLEVYTDNTKKTIEAYTKQFVLSNVLNEQIDNMESMTDTLNSKTNYYASAIENTQRELRNAYNELNSQENSLREYQGKLKTVKENFDLVYYPIKNQESEILQLQQDLINNQKNLQGNIEEIKDRQEEIDGLISSTKLLLSGKVDSATYSQVTSNLDEISDNLEEIVLSLEALEETYNDPTLTELINNLDNLIEGLDGINQELDSLDSELSLAISRTHSSKERIETFIIELDKTADEIYSFSSSLNGKKMDVQFKEAYSVGSNVVFVYFPIIVALILTFTSLILSNMFVLKQINEQSYFRDLITPTSDFTFIFADYLVNLFFVIVQGIALFFVGFFWFGVPLTYAPIFMLIVFLSASCFIFIGMGLGYIIKRQNLSMLITIFLVMILLIMSDLIAPSILTPQMVKTVVGFNLLNVLQITINKIIILRTGFWSIFSQIYLFLGVMVFSFIFAYIGKKICRKNISE